MTTRQPIEKPLAGAWSILIILCLVYILSFIDRSVINLMVVPIKAHFELSDIQISWLLGPTFVIAYLSFGILLATLADRYSRRWIIILGIIVWCLATTGSGLAGTFSILLLFRVLVGAGESSLTPSAASMFSDIFPRHKLGTVNSIYTTSPFIGTTLAFVIGGILLDRFSHSPLPYLEDLQPWQSTFILLGVIGLIAPLIVFLTVREPARHDVGHTTSEGVHKPYSIMEVIKFLLGNKRLYIPLIIGFAIFNTLWSSVLSWGPTFMMRVYDGVTNTEVGAAMGSASFIGGVLGTVLGGFAMDKLSGRWPSAAILVAFVAAIGTVIFSIVMVLAPTAGTAMNILIILIFFIGLPTGVSFATMQLVVPNRMRAQMMAIFLTVDSTVGQGFGPTITAVFTDYVFKDESMVGWSIVSTCAIAAVALIVLLLIAKKPFIEFTTRNSTQKDVEETIGRV